jgi:hypothetical protein
MLSGSRRRMLLDVVHSDLSLRSLSRRERLVLGALSLCTLALLCALQHNRVFFGDEIGTLNYLKESPGYILTHFGTWLSMNYFILVEKGVAWLSGGADWRLTLLPMAAAVAIIPLTASLALKFTGSARTALVAASLAAFNPYLVMWGPMIRAYSLLVALSLLTIIEFFHWYRQRNWWSGARCAAVVLLLLLAHLNGVYTVAFILLLLAAETVSAGWPRGRKFLWESRTLWIPLAGAAVVAGAAYWRLLPDIVKVSREWGTDTPPTSMGYIPQVFAVYVGGGYGIFLSGLLLLAGSWSAVREKRALLLLCGAIIMGPMLMSLQGVSVQSSAAARYLIFVLPWLLILMAEGVDWFARHLSVLKAGTVAAWTVTSLVVLCWVPSIHGRFVIKSQWPYASVAKFLHTQMRENDVIVAGWSMAFTLGQFFDDSKDRIMLPDKYVSEVATRLDAPLQGRVFYVTWFGLSDGRKANIRRFGGLEVTTYTGHTASELLQQWREDLLGRTNGRVAAPFHNDYQLLALLEERLPSGQSADHWRSLAERCRAQSSSEYVPKHLLKATRAVIFP